MDVVVAVCYFVVIIITVVIVIIVTIIVIIMNISIVFIIIYNNNDELLIRKNMFLSIHQYRSRFPYFYPHHWTRSTHVTNFRKSLEPLSLKERCVMALTFSCHVLLKPMGLLKHTFFAGNRFFAYHIMTLQTGKFKHAHLQNGSSYRKVGL